GAALTCLPLVDLIGRAWRTEDESKPEARATRVEHELLPLGLSPPEVSPLPAGPRRGRRQVTARGLTGGASACGEVDHQILLGGRVEGRWDEAADPQLDVVAYTAPPRARAQRRTRRGPAMEYVGIDLHKKESQICLLTETGEVMECRIRTDPQRF